MTGEEKAQLTRAGVATPEALESQLEINPSPVFGPLSGRTGISEQRLAQLVADSLQKTGKPLKRGLSKYWLDGFVFTIMAVIAFLVVRPWLFPPKPETKIYAAEDIPAFTVITERQLRVEGAGASSQQSALKQPFVGKYSPELIAKDNVVPSKIAGYEKTSFAGTMILRLEVKSFPSLEGRPFPQKVELVFASRNSGPAGIIVPALLLAIDGNSHVVTVALLAHDAQVASAWISSSDVTLVWRSP